MTKAFNDDVLRDFEMDAAYDTSVGKLPMQESKLLLSPGLRW